MSGFTVVPRWTLDPRPGVGEHWVRVPRSLVARLRRLTSAAAVPLDSVLLTAHAKVLGALSGEREVCTGYARDGSAPQPLHMTLEAASWREVLLEIARARSELLESRDAPVPDRTGQVSTEQPFETVFEMAPAPGELTDGVALRVAFSEAGAFALKVRYRTEVLDAECAARIAGYYLTALSLIAAHPDGEHARASLLSAEELQRQITGLAGPRRELPDRRPHEIFEERARMRPEAIAATCGNRSLTYRELNGRANRLARALLAHGLSREGVVAVVSERNLDWMTAQLAIFKAGGAYLPVEPRFPADRIARMLSRAGCRLVLTEHGSDATLDKARESLPGVEKLFMDAALEEDHPEGDLGTPVAPDQLAYIYFTSGSTGEPKGAMGEHAGLLNHLFAKIDALQIGQADAVAQTATQCFDISMWQLMSPLLVGGRTLIVEQETILDAQRFIDRIIEERVNIVQVVPSYLEVLCSSLAEHPRELPDLRYMVATGEALKKELVERWFAVQPRIRMVNAYGLTETSDDTNHEIMDRVPREPRVPLGRPVNNVHIYVVDEHLAPVPLGAPGEIVFSGVCVCRGYINDPERTRRAFMADPHRPGQRLYRGGDFGRWLPDGKLEYLGRRDHQVKISGFRIEIGEIENRLLRVPGVRNGAVVVKDHPDRGRQLVAFYSADRQLDTVAIRDALRESLPAYMVPSAFSWRETLPLNGSGKIDKKALTAIAAQLDAGGEDREKPRTATEHRLALAWAEVLGIPEGRIGRRDQFFDLGGTSLSALRLAIALGRAVSVKDLLAHPILADLAELMDQRLGPGAISSPLSVPDVRCAVGAATAPRAPGAALRAQARTPRSGPRAAFNMSFPRSRCPPIPTGR